MMTLAEIESESILRLIFGGVRYWGAKVVLVSLKIYEPK